MNREPKVLLGVCGSIAAVAVPSLLGWLRTALAVDDSDVILTASARRFVRVSAIGAATRGQVVSDWELPAGTSVATHVQFARRADLAVVLPATANFLGKVANGIADDLLTTTMLATTCPVLIFPVMNEAMWTKPSVRRNVATLRQDGIEVVAPQPGLSLTQNRSEVGSVGDFQRFLTSAITGLRPAPATVGEHTRTSEPERQQKVGH